MKFPYLDWRRLRALTAGLLGLSVVASVLALDPPHDASRNIQCITCHALHNSPGGTLNRVAGHANVCLACHIPAGQAAARPLASADQALPPMPNPSGWTAGRGISHRWDSGPSGHVKPVSGNTSTGIVASGGAYSGRIEEVYTITIATAGAAGSATFNWSSLRDGSGTGVLTGINIAIGGKGLTLSFANGAATPSFKAGDQWTLYARTDLRLPTTTDAFERPLGQRVMPEALPDRTSIGGLKVVCSTCHDQHSQKHPPFDPGAPAFFGAGSGWTATGIGRHLQRQPNENNEMCEICHSARNVGSSAQGSHPVGISLPGGNFRTPPNLPLSTDARIECMSCHAPHYQTSGGANAGAGDGFLLRQSVGNLCYECHTNADRAAGSHFNTSTGALWGGSKDLTGGTQFPPHSADKRGACINCHWPHGWPDRANESQDYPKLWVERYDTDRVGTSDGANGERLCFGCHTSQISTALGNRPLTPATSNLEGEFARGTALTSATGNVFRHPVNDVEQQLGPSGRRVVECVDCHNPHKATPSDRHAGVSGVDLAGNVLPAGTALQQSQVCFKCHGDSFNSNRAMTSNKRLDFAASNSAYHPVTQAGRNQSANLASQLLGGLNTSSTIRCTDCHNSSAFETTTGRVVDSSSVTVGPHGSAYAPILRANFNRNYTSGPTSYSATNFNLCFRCHDPVKLVTARDTGSGAATNFYDTINGKANLHWVHLNDKADKSRATCQNCHFDIHSNISAANTQYRVNNTLYADNAAVSAARIKTHMVNFSPDITAIGGRAKPEWWLDTATRERRCYMACHGTTMNGESGSGGKKAQYRPASGDEANWTY